MELTDFVQDCNTMQEVFAKCKKEDFGLLMEILSTGRRGGDMKVLEAKADFAVIKLGADAFSEGSMPPGEYLHPYGSSIGYTLKEKMNW